MAGTMTPVAMPPVSVSHPIVIAANGGVPSTPGAPSPEAPLKSGDIDTLAKNLLAGRRQDRGQTQDMMPRPKQVTYTVNNRNVGASPQEITAYEFNEDFLQATPTDNGGGAGSVVKTYSDNFNGNLLNEIIVSYGNEGLAFKQLQVTAIDNATGVQDKTTIDQLNPTKNFYNGDKTIKDEFLPLSSTGDPIYNQSGFLIMDIDMRVRRYEQIAYSVPVGKSISSILVCY